MEVDGEAASLLLLLLLGFLGRDGLERFAGDVDEVLERLLVLLGDLLRDRLVVAKRAQPEIRMPFGISSSATSPSPGAPASTSTSP